jgi:hypothetical protein
MKQGEGGMEISVDYRQFLIALCEAIITIVSTRKCY